MFQKATLMPWASVTADVRLPPDLAGTPRAAAAPCVRDALALVGLDRFGGDGADGGGAPA